MYGFRRKHGAHLMRRSRYVHVVLLVAGMWYDPLAFAHLFEGFQLLYQIIGLLVYASAVVLLGFVAVQHNDLL